MTELRVVDRAVRPLAVVSPAPGNPGVARPASPAPELDKLGPTSRGSAHDQRPLPPVDVAALSRHLTQVPLFGLEGKSVAQIELLGTERLSGEGQRPGSALALLRVRAELSSGETRVLLAPVELTRPDGKVFDAVGSAPFRRAMMEAILAGRRFDVPSRASTSSASSAVAPRPGKARGPEALGEDFHPAAEVAAIEAAMRGDAKSPWAPLLQKGYTTPDRLAFVREQAKALNPERADEITVRFFAQVAKTLDRQPPEIREFQVQLSKKPRFGPVLYGYAQYLAVPPGQQTSTFKDLVPFLRFAQGDDDKQGRVSRGVQKLLRRSRPEGLGFQTLELNPFFQSPMMDMGYDISDFFQVDAQFGGNREHQAFMKEAVKRGVRVIADLVANHVSNQHAWVQNVLEGDGSALPLLTQYDGAVKVGERKIDDKIFNVFLHTRGEDAGKVSLVWQIFDTNPETVVEVKVDGETHNLFSSFMNPAQIDLNNAHPRVLEHHFQVIGQYANLGQMGTRMDAIIHAFKQAGTDNINLPQSKALMALVKAFSSHVAPGSVLVPEANLSPEQARREWLDPERTFEGQVENVSGDALISFRSHEANIQTLLSRDKRAWLANEVRTGSLPPHKTQLTYLTLHDETLIPDEAVRQELLAKGLHDFAGRGVGDSLATVLGHDADRLAAALFLNYQQKGSPAVYYRTLVGAPNDEALFQANIQARVEAQQREGRPIDLQKATDTRDLDRGPIPAERYEQRLREGYKPTVTVRALNQLWSERPSVRTNDTEEISNPDPGVVSLARRPDEGADVPLLSLVNLTAEEKTVRLPAAELEDKLGWTGLADGKWVDLVASRLSKSTKAMAVRRSGDVLELRLAPYQFAYLEQPRSDWLPSVG